MVKNIFKRKAKVKEEFPLLREFPFKPANINNKIGFMGKSLGKVCYVELKGDLTNLSFITTIKEDGKLLGESTLTESYIETQGFAISRFPKEIRISKGFHSIQIKAKTSGLCFTPLANNRYYDVETCDY